MDRQESNKLNNYGVAAARPLINIVFSWSLEDVLNAHLYRNQVTKIPDTFSTVTSYMKSFIPSLVEETHADLLSSMMNLSQAPTLEILTVKTSKNHGPPKDLFYDVTCVGTYVPQVGDLIALTDIKPKCVDHLNGPRISYLIAYVHRSRDSNLSILSSKHIDTGRYTHIKSKTDTLFAVYLLNMTTAVRVWKALNSKGANTSLTKNLLQPQANSSQEKFDSIGECLKICMVNLYTHLPTSCMSIKVVKDMITALDLLNSCKYLFDEVGFSNETMQLVCILRSLRSFSVPILTDEKEIGNFCLENACLICCTVSSSSKLYTKGMKPVEILMVDEAAQLKECESLIPLQLPGLRHAILIGDQRQLPAMVKSKESHRHHQVVIDELKAKADNSSIRSRPQPGSLRFGMPESTEPIGFGSVRYEDKSNSE
ncbi:unnamed protein product [Malus baccata var. baccata]